MFLGQFIRNPNGDFTMLAFSFICPPMLSQSLATTAWCVLRLQMEEKPPRYGG
jgi:hypothetical protein